MISENRFLIGLTFQLQNIRGTWCIRTEYTQLIHIHKCIVHKIKSEMPQMALWIQEIRHSFRILSLSRRCRWCLTTMCKPWHTFGKGYMMRFFILWRIAKMLRPITQSIILPMHCVALTCTFFGLSFFTLSLCVCVWTSFVGNIHRPQNRCPFVALFKERLDQYERQQTKRTQRDRKKERFQTITSTKQLMEIIKYDILTRTSWNAKILRV